MYRGGTTVSVMPSRATSDATLEIKPVDPNIRALLNTLGGGTPDEADALRSRLDEVTGLPSTNKRGLDPWETMLWGLLFLRFPDVFGPIPVMMTGLLANNLDWAYDAHVIAARRVLLAASDEPAILNLAIADALTSLTRAQAAGSPYFGYTNQLFSDMLQSMANYEEIDADLRPKLERIMTRTKREYSLQRAAGFSFSWLSRDPELLKSGVLAPNRHSSGTLRGRDTTILFAGSIERGRIMFDTRQSTGKDTVEQHPLSLQPDNAFSLLDRSTFVQQPSSLREARFIRNRVADDGPRKQFGYEVASDQQAGQDPNEGRFGGKSKSGKFSLKAEFATLTDRAWVTITLVVEAREDQAVKLGDQARFHLHPTFSPDQIDVMFRGRRAVLTVNAWGGFVVGVTLSRQNVMLECNLALLPGAPRIIRER
jgi:hypothetical protein